MKDEMRLTPPQLTVSQPNSQDVTCYIYVATNSMTQHGP